MSEILEIRDGCQTPLELLTSQTFNKYLDIYKQKFLSELKSESSPNKQDEILHKKKILLNKSIQIYLSKFLNLKIFLMQNYQFTKSIRFLEGLFHHFRKKSYTRLIKLHNEILSSKESAESIKKDRI